MWINIKDYDSIIHISDFAKLNGVDRNNCTRVWNEGKRAYLKDTEEAMKIGRDWYVLGTAHNVARDA